MILDRHSVRPLKKSDEAILLIGGKRTAQGTLDDILVRFHQEAARTAASVEVKVRQKNGTYKTKFKQIRPTSA